MRRRNWLAIALATVAMMFSYFPYAAAFADSDGESGTINMGLVAIGLAVAPFVFVLLGFVSANKAAPRRVMQSMVLLPLVGLGVGLLSPAVGATAAFGVGAALCLNPPDAPYVYRWRMGAVALTVVYTTILLITVTPAGVFTGGLLPLMMVGFADEYLLWGAARARME